MFLSKQESGKNVNTVLHTKQESNKTTEKRLKQSEANCITAKKRCEPEVNQTSLSNHIWDLFEHSVSWNMLDRATSIYWKIALQLRKTLHAVSP